MGSGLCINMAGFLAPASFAPGYPGYRPGYRRNGVWGCRGRRFKHWNL